MMSVKNVTGRWRRLNITSWKESGTFSHFMLPRFSDWIFFFLINKRKRGEKIKKDRKEKAKARELN